MKRMANTMDIPESEDSVSVSEAARMIQCSRSKVYQYIKEGRLSSYRVSRMLRLPKKEVQQFQASLPGDVRAKTSLRKQSDHSGDFVATTIHVPIRPGKRKELEKQFAAEEVEQRYTFTGSVSRYILGDDESIEIILIWNKAEMPDEAIWQSDLQLFQQAFADLLSWESATLSFGNVLRHA